MYFVWYDDNPTKPIEAKIDEAIGRYIERYGQQPSVCMLNDGVPATDYAQVAAATHIQVMAARNVPRNYFWVGVA